MFTIRISSLITFLFMLCSGLLKASEHRTFFLLSDSIAPTKMLLSESKEQVDIITSDYLITALQPIRDNYKKLNSTEKWTRVDTVPSGKSKSGEMIRFFYIEDQLQKIIHFNYTSKGQVMTEYYLMDGKLSFVLEKQFELDETSVDDARKNRSPKLTDGKVTEERSYFENGQLVHRIGSAEVVMPLSGEYLADEQKRVIAMYDEILKRAKKK